MKTYVFSVEENAFYGIFQDCCAGDVPHLNNTIDWFLEGDTNNSKIYLRGLK
jgi:hypothetical protein